MRSLNSSCIAMLGLLLILAIPLRAQVTSPHYTSSDSAAVLNLVVDDLISDDSITAAARRSATVPAREDTVAHPRVYVRIGEMPKGAWAEPSVARLRAWQWFYHGWAMDSTLAKTEPTRLPASAFSRPFPVALGIRLRFVGDTARVQVSWDEWTCESGNMLRAVLISIDPYVRTASGWKLGGTGIGAVADVLCGMP